MLAEENVLDFKVPQILTVVLSGRDDAFIFVLCLWALILPSDLSGP